MSNAELIAEVLAEYGTDREHMLDRMDVGYHVARLIYALEEADRKIKLARAVFVDSEDDEDVSNAMDIALA